MNVENKKHTMDQTTLLAHHLAQIPSPLFLHANPVFAFTFVVDGGPVLDGI